MKKPFLSVALLFAGLVLFGLSFFISGNSSGEVDVEIVNTRSIMPAAHHVYANPDALNGRYYLFKAKITNNTGKTLEDVTVRYRIPGYIDWTKLDVIGEMFPGQIASVRCYPKFKDDITEKMTESVEKVEIEILWDGAGEDDIVEEEFDFKILDRNRYMFTNLSADEISGWGDVYYNDVLLACFVTPNDPIVKYYTQNIQEKILKGETAGVKKEPREAVRFLLGIYEATRLAHMVYSGTKGVPEFIEDYTKYSQYNRLPREVITGNTGLCLELSLLYASVLSIAGLDPVIFLIPGHAYPGFRLGGNYYAIEATGIGGEGLGSIMSAEKAFEVGQKELEEFIQKVRMGDPRYSLIDIHALHYDGVTPMNLKDDLFLRQKVDEIVKSWTAPNQPVRQAERRANTNQSAQNKNQNNPDSNSRRPNTNRAFSVMIPPGWNVVRNPMPSIPILTAQIISPDQMTVISVYDIQANSTKRAMKTLNQYVMKHGMFMHYKIKGDKVSGKTISVSSTVKWIGKSLRKQNNIRLVAVGARSSVYDQNEALINQIYQTIY